MATLRGLTVVPGDLIAVHRTSEARSGQIIVARIASRSGDEVAKLIGADWLIYQDLEDLIAACVHDHSSIKEFDTSCFSGNYVTGDVTPEYLARLESERSDLAKASRRDAERTALKVVKN